MCGAVFLCPVLGIFKTWKTLLSRTTCCRLARFLYLVFCVSKGGWGWKNFIAEADAGQGLKFPKWARGYLTYVLPALILIIFVMGYVPKFQTWFGLGA